MTRQKQLLMLAKQIADKTDNHSIVDVTLSGSVSRGNGDVYSDIELDFWCNEIPAKHLKKDILEPVSDSEIHFREPEEDGAEISEFTYNNIPIEVTWQSFSNFEKVINSVYVLETTDHDIFVYLWTIKFQQHLKGSGRINEMQRKLINEYPSGLDKLLIEKVLAEDLLNPESRWADLERGEFLSLYQKIINQVKSILRLLYALNKQWEPYWKWINHVTKTELEKKPENFEKRLLEIFQGFGEPRTALNNCFLLFIDTLKCIKDNQDIIDDEIINKKILLIENYI